MKFSKYFLVLMLAMLLTFSCQTKINDTDDTIHYDEITDIHYDAHIQPLLDEYTTRLQNESLYPEGLETDSWQHLFEGWKNGAAVIPYDAQGSLFYQLIGMLKDTTEGDAARRDLIRRWIEAGAPNEQGVIPFDDATDIVYVCNQGASSVSLVDVNHLVVMRTLYLEDYGFSDHAKPHHIVVEPDGTAWYVSLIADGKVVKFDSRNRIVGSVDTPTPGLMTLHPTRRILYAGRSMTAPNPPSSVLAINTSDMTYREIPVPYARPHALAIQPNRDYLISASLVENKFAVIDAQRDELDATYTFPDTNPVYVQCVFVPDGTSFFATGQLSATLYRFAMDSEGVVSADGSYALGEQPWHPVIIPDGTQLFVGNKVSNSVSVFDIIGNQVSATLQGNGVASPHGSTVTSDGKYVFISNQNTNGDYQPPFRDDAASVGTITVFDATTHALVKTIEVGTSPSGIAHK